MQALARFLSILLSLYSMVIVVRIFLQWLRMPGASENMQRVNQILGLLADPYLELFKGLKALRKGMLDFTPIAALLVLGVVQRILSWYAQTGRFTLAGVLAILIQTLWWSVGSLIVGAFCILLGIRFWFCWKRNPSSIQVIATLDRWTRPIVNQVHIWIFRGGEISDRMLIGTSLAGMILVYVLCSVSINLLLSFLATVRF